MKFWSSWGVRAVLAALALVIFELTSFAQGTTYYEVWRNTSVNLDSATRIASWLEGTTCEDNTAASDEDYYYWVRAVTAETVSNSWVNLSFSQNVWFTCPTAVQRATTCPTKAEVELGGGIFGPTIATLRNEIREDDVFLDDDLASWSVSNVWVDNLPPRWRRKWTIDVNVGSAELIGDAEVYFRSNYGNTLWLPTPRVDVEIRDYSDPPPTKIAVSRVGSANRITWDAVAGNTSFSLPSRLPRYTALIIGSTEPFSGYAERMKGAMLSWDRVFWSEDNIVTLEDPTRKQVKEQISSLTADADFFLFAYAGHGGKNDYVHGDPELVPPSLTERDEFLIWYTEIEGLGRVEQLIFDDDLAEWLSSFDGPVLSIIHSCYSGGFWNGNDEGDLESLQSSCLYASAAEDDTIIKSDPLWANLLEGCATGDAAGGDDVITVQEWYDFAETGTPSYMFGNIPNFQIFAIPEPATLTLLAAGLAALLVRKRRT